MVLKWHTRGFDYSLYARMLESLVEFFYFLYDLFKYVICQMKITIIKWRQQFINKYLIV